MHSSLRKKISLAFIALALINVTFAGLAFFNLKRLQGRVQDSWLATDFEYTIQEMRRHEKNLFLYKDSGALQDAQDFSILALDMIRNKHDTLLRIAGSQELARLQDMLQQYNTSLTHYSLQTSANPKLIESIRSLGHRILGMANNMIQSQRLAKSQAIERAQNFLLILMLLLAIFIFILASLLMRMVITPLKRMTINMDAIAQGNFSRMVAHSKDRELVALSQAFNHMLDELDARRRHLLHSEKLASLGVLTAGVAHEINNPLSNISSSCQLLQEEIRTASPEQLAEWASLIDSETQRARNIVKALLGFGRRQDMNIQDVELLPLVQQTLVLLRGNIRKQHAEIEVEIPARLHLQADAQHLQQILINLIRNALDTGKDGIHIKISARVLMRKTGFPSDTLVAGNLEHFARHASPAVHLAIEDNGPGIAADVYPKIFDPFYTTREPGSGMGLGLYIVQEIIQEHDGIIAIFSTPGEGTRVLLQLPTQQSAHDPVVNH